MSGTILVTGGTIGKFVVDGLTEKGKKVRVSTYKKQAKPSWGATGIEQVEVDYTKPETLVRAFEGIESYFSVSPLIQELSETGIEAANAARKAGVRRIVRSSVLGAATNSVTFGRWHFDVEKAIEASGLSFTILLPTSFMQNYFGFARFDQEAGKIPRSTCKFQDVASGRARYRGCCRRGPYRTWPRFQKIQNNRRRGHLVAGKCDGTLRGSRNTRRVRRRFQIKRGAPWREWVCPCG